MDQSKNIAELVPDPLEANLETTEETRQLNISTTSIIEAKAVS